ncbi:MAG: acyl-CoA dehydrogenase [Planctomycetaceae bacterium]
MIVPLAATSSSSRAPLVVALREAVSHPPGEPRWPESGWSVLHTHGVLRWVLPASVGGDEADAAALLAGCVDLARGCLTTAFIYSQHLAACQRLRAAHHPTLWREWATRLSSKPLLLTVGVSHLTTSRQHLGRPAVLAVPDGPHFRLTGEIPWVTAASRAEAIVAGATLADGRQLLALIETTQPGVRPAAAPAMVALSGSLTSAVALDAVLVSDDALIQQPVLSVMKTGSGPTAGSLTTSALALGHTWHLLDQLVHEARQRPDVRSICDPLLAQATRLQTELFAAAQGDSPPPDDTCGRPAPGPERLRAKANSLVLRTAQIALAISKGSGFLESHPIGRLTREALFFLVWSCPQPVLALNLEQWLRDPEEPL